MICRQDVWLKKNWAVLWLLVLSSVDLVQVVELWLLGVKLCEYQKNCHLCSISGNEHTAAAKRYLQWFLQWLSFFILSLLHNDRESVIEKIYKISLENNKILGLHKDLPHCVLAMTAWLDKRQTLNLGL